MPENEKANGNIQKCLESLSKSAFDEYKIISIDIPNQQIGYLKTYLWLASLLAAAELSLFNNILGQNFPRIDFLNRQPTMLFYILASVSLLSSVIVFGFGVDTLRGRKPHAIPLGDLMRVAGIAKSCPGDSQELYYNSIINAYNNAIKDRAELCHQVGLKLRQMSRLVLLSVLFAVLAVAAMNAGLPVKSADSSPLRHKEVIPLTEESKEPPTAPPTPPTQSDVIHIEPTMIAINSIDHGRPGSPAIQGRQENKKK